MYITLDNDQMQSKLARLFEPPCIAVREVVRHKQNRHLGNCKDRNPSPSHIGLGQCQHGSLLPVSELCISVKCNCEQSNSDECNCEHGCFELFISEHCNSQKYNYEKWNSKQCNSEQCNSEQCNSEHCNSEKCNSKQCSSEQISSYIY